MCPLNIYLFSQLNVENSFSIIIFSENIYLWRMHFKPFHVSSSSWQVVHMPLFSLFSSLIKCPEKLYQTCPQIIVSETLSNNHNVDDNFFFIYTWYLLISPPPHSDLLKSLDIKIIEQAVVVDRNREEGGEII